MSAPTIVVTNAPKAAWQALIASGTPKLILATNTHVPNQDTDDFANDITNEAAGTGYSSGGIALAGVTVTVDTTANTITIKCNEISGISVSCRWGYFIVSTGTLSTSPIMSYTDFSQGSSVNTTLTGTTSLSTAGFLVDTVT